MQVIEFIFNTGQTLFFQRRGIVAGVRQIWNTTLNLGAGGWEAFNSGHWAQYAIPMTEEGTGYYWGTGPNGTSGIQVTDVVYQQGGVSPTYGQDTPCGIGQGAGQNVGAINGDAVAAGNLAKSLECMTVGAVAAGSISSVSFPTTIVNADPNAYQGLTLRWPAGTTLAGQGGVITGWNPSTQTITVSAPFAGTPAQGDAFIIV